MERTLREREASAQIKNFKAEYELFAVILQEGNSINVQL
tara:strand:- start:854 stop:970 length:117 start_codon:yes stop_codon:yes gene_type:complete